MSANGGEFAADELVPTDAADFSAYLLKIRNAKPDLVVSNLAGAQITNFMKQYMEFGLPFPVAGFGFDTVVAWGAGKGNFSGIWPLVWHHLVDTPSSKKYVEAFQKKYGKLPDNQSWGDYNSLKIVAQAMNETKSADPQKLAEHLRKGAKFDVMKAREAYFRPYDNQMVMEMYAVRAKEPAKMKDQWDIYDALGAPQHFTARVDALDARIVEPDTAHGFHVEPLERSVEVPVGPRHRLARLVFRSAHRWLRGEYTCRAANKDLRVTLSFP
jgi:branched-chain amino acid transport system substrate-binding protein